MEHRSMRKLALAVAVLPTANHVLAAGQLGRHQRPVSGLDGSVLTSSLTNAFSTSAVPGPIAGAGLPGLITLLGGGGLWWRRKRKVA
jgi:LPXTG-motif cell wall-anchored protein